MNYHIFHMFPILIFVLAAALGLSSLIGAEKSHFRDVIDVESFTYGPSSVQVNDGVFTASITVSSPNGINSVMFSSLPLQGWWMPCPDVKKFELTNGTTYAGTWTASCGPFDESTPEQQYSIKYVATDTAKNDAYEIVKDGFTVMGGPIAEYDSPVLSKVTTGADTVTAGSTVDIYTTIQDASGIDTTASYIQVRQGAYSPCVATGFTLVSGTATDGVYKASCALPTSTVNGEYELDLHVYDTQKNPAELVVEGAFAVEGGADVDTIPPKFADFTYANDKVSVGDTLTVTVTVSDDGSGVSDVHFVAKEPQLQTKICSGPMTKQSGDETSGVWGYSCVIPDGTYMGVYTGEVYATDKQNNQGFTSKGFQVV